MTIENKSEISFYELPVNLPRRIDLLILGLIEYLEHNENSNNDILYSPIINFEEDENIEISSDIETEIKEIIKQLEEIKKKGLLITALPVLEKMTSIYNKKIDSKPSFLKVDENFRILLPEFEMEIKMSHLTKSLYFLFLLVPEGIHFDDLSKHKDLLFKIYSKVSNQGDLQKLKSNIDNLISDKDAFYVHLSRIKSAFYSKFQESIAKNYIVKSPKNEPKVISLFRGLTNLEDLKNYFYS